MVAHRVTSSCGRRPGRQRRSATTFGCRRTDRGGWGWRSVRQTSGDLGGGERRRPTLPSRAAPGIRTDTGIGTEMPDRVCRASLSATGARRPSWRPGRGSRCPSFPRTCSTWVSTVRWEITSRAAISLLLRPSASSSAISRSRLVRPPGASAPPRPGAAVGRGRSAVVLPQRDRHRLVEGVRRPLRERALEGGGADGRGHRFLRALLDLDVGAGLVDLRPAGPPDGVGRSQQSRCPLVGRRRRRRTTTAPGRRSRCRSGRAGAGTAARTPAGSRRPGRTRPTRQLATPTHHSAYAFDDIAPCCSASASACWLNSSSRGSSRKNVAAVSRTRVSNSPSGSPQRPEAGTGVLEQRDRGRQVSAVEDGVSPEAPRRAPGAGRRRTARRARTPPPASCPSGRGRRRSAPGSWRPTARARGRGVGSVARSIARTR